MSKPGVDRAEPKATMTGVIATIPRIQFSNALGLPLAGGKLYTYLAGTTTPVATFQDQDLTIKNENPIELDATGSCVIWLDPAKSYKFLLKSALGITQPGWPVDNIVGAATPLSLEPTLSFYAKLTALAAAAGASLMGFIQAGVGAVKRTVQDKLRETIDIEDFMTAELVVDALSGAPVLDHTAAWQKAINAAMGKNLRGKATHTYRFTDTLNFPKHSHVKFRGAGIVDDVQGNWPPSDGNRAKPLFFIYDVDDVEIEGFDYRAAPTRSTLGNDDAPTAIIWIGDNRGGAQPTTNISIRKIKAKNCVPGTLFVSVTGNAHDIEVKQVDITGPCSYGFNAEYGQAATEGDRYGMHPYNITVEQFNGYDNPTSVGFLRVASCYNVKFLNCYGKDVASFIYAWAGDRGINRVSQNVLYENCSHYASDNFLPGKVNYVVSIMAISEDGSTGEQLPSWTNYDHLITIRGGNLQNNKTPSSACLRYYGTQGKTVIDGCVLQGSYWGVRAEPPGSVTYPIMSSLIMRNLVFKFCSQDVVLRNIRGVLMENCSHKHPDGTLVPILMEYGAAYNKVRDGHFSGLPTDIAWARVEAGCDWNDFTGNLFEDSGGAGSAPPLELLSVTVGANNTNRYSAQGLTKTGAEYFGVLNEPSTMEFDLANLSGTSVDCMKRTSYVALTGGVNKTISSIVNGEVGDVVTFRAVSPFATVTFVDNAPGAGTPNRILTPATGDLVKTGSRWTVTAYRTSEGWVLS